MKNKKIYDVVIIGGGHAGCEAAYISSQFDLNIALISMPGIGLASAPCNPSIGGVGKGQIVRELDALGGLMPELADMSGIQFRTLNESKGYAVRSTRVQIDKEAYSFYAEEVIRSIENINLIYGQVDKVQKVEGYFEINLKNNQSPILGTKVVVTTGTFLNGKLHSGKEQNAGGRQGCAPSTGVDDIFTNVKKLSKRFKTGTPARILKDSIHFSELEEQPSDVQTRNFSSKNPFNNRNLKQLSCYLTYTNEKTLEIIRNNKEKSPMYNGQITGVGARYCPSIEDKAYRYPDKNIHHVFLEPEGLNLQTFYPSGISSSLPGEIQDNFIKTIKGLESSEFDSYGYAVEYDVIDTSMLGLTLEYLDVPGLYFAGQVNGTSGYEEAAAQGMVAGINAAMSFLGKKEIIFSRNDSYIGVLIEDLVLNSRDEPYRLFTARAENRLYLREDNSIVRMCPYRTSMGLMSERDVLNQKFIVAFTTTLKSLKLVRFTKEHEIFSFMTSNFEEFKAEEATSLSIQDILKKPYINPIVILENIFVLFGLDLTHDLISAIALTLKYDGYIALHNEINEKISLLDGKKINWEKIINSSNVSFECRQRIEKYKPQTFSQLKKIEGIRPATLSVVATDSL